MKALFHLFLILLLIIPLLSENLLGRKSRLAIYKIFHSGLSANTSKEDKISTTGRSFSNSKAKTMEEDFDESENSDEEQENEELEEDA
jgi:hypothetical protein